MPDSGANTHLIERFTRTDANTLLYEFTVDDPTIWTRPWTAVVPMARSDEPIYEYACHEGNYAMAGILAGARAEEKAAEEAAKKRIEVKIRRRDAAGGHSAADVRPHQ